MIDLKFGLFWSGSKLSYLRYLTFKTLRHYHPDSEIQLYIATSSAKDGYKWNNENQDFEHEIGGDDYIDKLKDLNVRIFEGDFYPDYTPNYQSDFFRWWWLSKNSGFYLDTDQIVLKSFESLPRDCEILYTHYKLSWGRSYYPVGVIGSNSNSKVVTYINKILPQYIDTSDYNSGGPWMFDSVMNTQQWGERHISTPSSYFYPIPESNMMKCVYDGNFKPPDCSYSLHWFGGLQLSQQFNNIYTPEMSHKSDDTISSILRNKNMI